MSDLLSLLLIVVLVISAACNELRPHAIAAPAAKAVSKIDFDTQLKPIFEKRCQPCHFSGGKVYAKMPFDRGETIKRLGTKLFTRIKDTSEQELIRQYLEGL